MHTIAQRSDPMAILAQLRSEMEACERRLVSLKEDIAAVERYIEIAQRTAATGDEAAPSAPLVFYASPPQAPPAAQPSVRLHDLAKKVRGKSQLEALRIIARENGGIVRTAEAKHVLLAARLAKGNPKHMGPHIFNMLGRSDEFEKVGVGEFRWLRYAAPKRDAEAAGRVEKQEDIGGGAPGGASIGPAQETPPPERNGYGRVGLVPSGEYPDSAPSPALVSVTAR